MPATKHPAAKAIARPLDSAGAYELIWAVTARIPRGSVATYGQIARLAGLPRQARLVGYALHGLPEDSPVPWHRVVNARGMLSFPVGSDLYRLQRHRLREEEVVIANERINLALYGWKPQPDQGSWEVDVT